LKFKYSARTKDGELQVGFAEAPTKEMAENILSSHGLFVLSIEGGEGKSVPDIFLGFLKRVKTSDIMIFTRQFATLLESEVPLSDALRNLHKQTKNPILKEAVFSIASDVNAGLSLSQAIERQSDIFSEFYFNTIRSAEVTGRLEETMSFLADYLEKETNWRSKIRNAMIYPIFILVLLVAVAILLLVVVFPKLAPVFEEMGTEIPIFTKIFLSVGNFMLDWWWLIILVAGMGVILLLEYLQTSEGQVVMNELKIRMPIFGDLFKKIYVARFSESVRVLVKGGVPIAQAIEISSHNIGNIAYRDILHEVSENVRAGEMLSSLLLKNSYYFPDLVGQMVAIGESTGRLDETLSRVSVLYTREVDNTLNNLSELIQPILISVIGIFIGLLFAAVLVPIYNIAQGFKL
jgi:type IV pilus assembly protein PilC